MFGRLLRIGLALLTVSTAGIVPTQPAGAAAIEGLRYESHTSYTVDPGAAAVHVVLDATITNQQPDRRTADGVLHYFFPTTAVPVLAEATNFAATRADGRPLTVHRETEGDDQFAVAVVDLVPDLDYGQTAQFRLTYDLPHLPPRSAGFTRVNAAFATFAAFGYGDPGLTSFEIRVPDGFKVEFTGADLKKDEVDGMQRLTSGALDDPDNTFAVVAARHDDGLLTRPLELDSHKIVIRAWPDDPAWGAFVEQKLTNGIPAMESLVGLPWPHPDDELSIVEAASPYIYGYAGWFLPETNSIEVGDDLDPRVILHELSHLWFNNRLFVERWISEAFAETYAAHTLAAIGEPVPAPDPVRADSPAALALAAWDDPSFTEDNTAEREEYGYNTSFFVVNSVAGEIGMDAMRKVVAATEKRSIAYQGDGKPEGVVTRVDSRRLLDLMQQLGGSTAAPPLFGQYVLRPEDAARLPARAGARDQYAVLVAAGAGWSPPYPVRAAMSDWDFDAATTRMQAATAILATARRSRDQGQGAGPRGAPRVRAPVRERQVAGRHRRDRHRARGRDARDRVRAGSGGPRSERDRAHRRARIRRRRCAARRPQGLRGRRRPRRDRLCPPSRCRRRRRRHRRRATRGRRGGRRRARGRRDLPRPPAPSGAGGHAAARPRAPDNRARAGTVDVDAVVRAIGGLTLVGRPQGGVSGAVFNVRDGNGRTLVLKLAGGDLDVERAAATCARLRRRGYPAPVVVQTGRSGAVDYILSEALPGEPMTPTTLARLPQLLALVDVQRGIGVPSDSPWIAALVSSVVEGRVGYCDQEPLRTRSDETRALLDRLLRIASAADDFDVPVDDIVHFDFSHANVLSVDGEIISGVIDWEATTTGDAAFDLVTHALYTYDLDARDALLAAAAGRTDPRVLPLYAAHMVLRQVSWSLRNADDFTTRWWLDLGTALLDAVAAG